MGSVLVGTRVQTRIFVPDNGSLRIEILNQGFFE